MILMRAICRNCHFLSKEYRDQKGNALAFSLTANERENSANSPREMVAKHYSLNCHLGVWDEASTTETDRESIINLVPRSSGCFYFPYHPGMLFEAARELQKRSDELKEMKRSNLYTRIGLWVAAGALAVNALVAYLKNF